MAGSQFVVHRDLVEPFASLYEAKIVEWHQKGICDDDQNLVLQVYFDNRALFELFPSDEWFSLFRLHLNQKNP